ncbi:MAG: cupin domain-containing protein [Rhizobiaceae bacterium]|nr:cupin domain-containing protein [Rhizobiaceae bacterium]
MNKALLVPNLLENGWQDLPFEPFRPGVEICELVAGWPRLALLKYEPGASVPRHRHTGLETILVLSGAQSDENGASRAGALIANPTGSQHSVWSDEGCVVLIQWEKPIEILDEPETTTDGTTDNA